MHAHLNEDGRSFGLNAETLERAPTPCLVSM